MLHKLLLCLSLLVLYINCESKQTLKTSITIETETETQAAPIHFLKDIAPLTADGAINAVIEIPAGTLDKGELDKATGQMIWELKDNKPRVVDYMGYPGNYGMIPRTLLPKDQGGDGDPLDILVLGPPVAREHVLQCKLIGVLYLEDRGEQDDKLIAISSDSPMYDVQSFEELHTHYKGVTDIVQLWFTHYKGPDKMVSKGFGDTAAALEILHTAITAYELNTEVDK